MKSRLLLPSMDSIFRTRLFLQAMCHDRYTPLTDTHTHRHLAHSWSFQSAWPRFTFWCNMDFRMISSTRFSSLGLFCDCIANYMHRHGEVLHTAAARGKTGAHNNQKNQQWRGQGPAQTHGRGGGGLNPSAAGWKEPPHPPRAPRAVADESNPLLQIPQVHICDSQGTFRVQSGYSQGTVRVTVRLGKSWDFGICWIKNI